MSRHKKASKKAPHPEASLGLHILWPKDGSRGDTIIDIITIHGLDTTSPDTWQWQSRHKDGTQRIVNWLSDEDMLPKAIPEARICTFNWNANYYQASPVDTILGKANVLLKSIHDLRLEDMETSPRPIIFVASCFGGLVLMKACIKAASGDNPYHAILLATIGAIFLGTPFQGSKGAGPAKWLLLVNQLLGENTSDLLIKDLDAKTRVLQDDLLLFSQIAREAWLQLPIVCYYETMPTVITRKYLPSRISKAIGANFPLVTKESAVIHTFPHYAMDVPHVLMNKFHGPSDSNFKSLVGTMREFILKKELILATRQASSRPTSQYAAESTKSDLESKDVIRGQYQTAAKQPTAPMACLTVHLGENHVKSVGQYEIKTIEANLQLLVYPLRWIGLILEDTIYDLVDKKRLLLSSKELVILMGVMQDLQREALGSHFRSRERLAPRLFDTTRFLSHTEISQAAPDRIYTRQTRGGYLHIYFGRICHGHDGDLSASISVGVEFTPFMPLDLAMAAIFTLQHDKLMDEWKTALSLRVWGRMNFKVLQLIQTDNLVGIREHLNTREITPFDRDLMGKSIVGHALVNGATKIFRQLLESGGDLKHCDLIGILALPTTPASRHIGYDHFMERCQGMLEFAIRANDRNLDHGGPFLHHYFLSLYRAYSRGRRPYLVPAEQMLDLYPNLEELDDEGRTLLLVAAQYFPVTFADRTTGSMSIELASLVLRKGADVNVCDSLGRGVYQMILDRHAYSDRGSLDLSSPIICSLLSSGINLNALDEFGRSPWEPMYDQLISVEGRAFLQLHGYKIILSDHGEWFYDWEWWNLTKSTGQDEYHVKTFSRLRKCHSPSRPWLFFSKVSSNVPSDLAYEAEAWAMNKQRLLNRSIRPLHERAIDLYDAELEVIIGAWDKRQQNIRRRLRNLRETRFRLKVWLRVSFSKRPIISSLEGWLKPPLIVLRRLWSVSTHRNDPLYYLFEELSREVPGLYGNLISHSDAREFEDFLREYKEDLLRDLSAKIRHGQAELDDWHDPCLKRSRAQQDLLQDYLTLMAKVHGRPHPEYEYP